VSIYLSAQPVDQLDPPPPFIRLYIWHGLGDLAGRTWSLAGDDAQGSAQLCAEGGECELASAGSVSVVAVNGDSTVEASAVLQFATAGEISGGIVARWIPRTIFCL
jgi:hypothetical protein